MAHGAAAWLGRWISCDPAGLSGGTNLYVYANNNPSILVDPNGAFPKLPTLQEVTARAHQGVEQAKELAQRVSEGTKQAVVKGIEAALPFEVGLVNANIKLAGEVGLQGVTAVLDPTTPFKAVAHQAAKPFAAPVKFVRERSRGIPLTTPLSRGLRPV